MRVALSGPLIGMIALTVSDARGQGNISGDFLLRTECIGTSSATVTVVGSWSVPGVQGWSWGLCHDPAAASIEPCEGIEGADNPCTIAGCAGVSCPPDMASVGPWGRPSFHAITIYDYGITQGVALDFMATWSLDERERFEMLTISYRLLAESAGLTFCDRLDIPPLGPIFIVGGGEVIPAVQAGITLPCVGGPPRFKRGDASSDGMRTVADAVYVARYVFGMGPPPACHGAADANDDGAVTIADAIAVLAHLFGGAGPLPAPSAHCGVDPTPDALPCAAYRPCAP